MNVEFNRNEDVMKLSLTQLQKHLHQVSQGGGKKAIEKQHEKNKLTARERIAYLFADNSLLKLVRLSGGKCMKNRRCVRWHVSESVM